MAAVQPPRKRRARQSEAEECEDDAWSLCFADERPYSDSSDDDDDEEVLRLEAALAAAKAKKKREELWEIAEELWELQEREAYFRRTCAEFMGVPLSDAESEDDGSDSKEEGSSDSEEEESSDPEECVIM